MGTRLGNTQRKDDHEKRKRKGVPGLAADLLDELLLALLDNVRVRVAHHGDQHVEQQYGHQHHEYPEHRLAEDRVSRVAQVRVLQHTRG